MIGGLGIAHVSAESNTRCDMKKIQKTIGMSMIALVVIALSAGMAAAATVDIVDDPIINPLDSSTVTTTTVDVTHIDYSTYGNSHNRYVSIETFHSGLSAKVTGPGGLDTGWVTNGMAGAGYTATSPPSDYAFTLHVKGTAPGEVYVADNAGDQYIAKGSDSASCTRPADIPEFATIAIPVVALLGLVFFMRRRKE